MLVAEEGIFSVFDAVVVVAATTTENLSPPLLLASFSWPI